MTRGSFINTCLAITLLSFSYSALAEKPPESSAAQNPNAALTSTSKPVFVQNIAPEAADAVKVVDAFSAALKNGKFDAVQQYLDPKVLVLESGGSERSRDEYMSSHAIADSLFLGKAKSQLRYRQAHAQGDMAWVGTESELQSIENGKPLSLLSTETMLLKKTAQGWKVVHIHWSSRPVTKR